MGQAPRALVALAFAPGALLGVGLGVAADAPGHYATAATRAAAVGHVATVDADPSGALKFTRTTRTVPPGRTASSFTTPRARRTTWPSRPTARRMGRRRR